MQDDHKMVIAIVIAVLIGITITATVDYITKYKMAEAAMENGYHQVDGDWVK